ncbi:MAG: hypothetical protein EBS19_11690 [Spirochaetia bacterium]|nr:hypothetical protein [Spirochaetia bacterium]
MKFTIKEILNHYKGQESTTKFNRRSDGYKYTSLIMDEIEKSRDDGYPDYLIFNDLEKIYSEMK